VHGKLLGFRFLLIKKGDTTDEVKIIPVDRECPLIKLRKRI
jgi:hypothetical protein